VSGVIGEEPMTRTTDPVDDRGGALLGGALLGGAPLTEPSFGRGAVIGAAIGFVTVAAAVTAGCASSGVDLASSLGLGAFVGLWGGAAFGFMMGGTLPYARHADAEAAARERRAGDPNG
jgi:hypothetical protein